MQFTSHVATRHILALESLTGKTKSGLRLSEEKSGNTGGSGEETGAGHGGGTGSRDGGAASGVAGNAGVAVLLLARILINAISQSYLRSSVRAAGARGTGNTGVASAGGGRRANSDGAVADGGGGHAGGVGDRDHGSRVAGLLGNLGADSGRVGSSHRGGRGGDLASRVATTGSRLRSRAGNRGGGVGGSSAVAIGRGGHADAAGDGVDGARGDSRPGGAVGDSSSARGDGHVVGLVQSASGHSGTSEENGSSETHLEGI